MDSRPRNTTTAYSKLGWKYFCFGLNITSDNVTNGSDTFKISEVWSEDHIQRIESLSRPISLIESLMGSLVER